MLQAPRWSCQRLSSRAQPRERPEVHESPKLCCRNVEFCQGGSQRVMLWRNKPGWGCCGWLLCTCRGTRPSESHLLSCTAARLQHVLVLDVCVHHSEPVHLWMPCLPLSRSGSTTPCRTAAQERSTPCSTRLGASLPCNRAPLKLFRSEIRCRSPLPLSSACLPQAGEMGEPRQRNFELGSKKSAGGLGETKGRLNDRGQEEAGEIAGTAPCWGEGRQERVVAVLRSAREQFQSIHG